MMVEQSRAWMNRVSSTGKGGAMNQINKTLFSYILKHILNTPTPLHIPAGRCSFLWFFAWMQIFILSAVAPLLCVYVVQPCPRSNRHTDPQLFILLWHRGKEQRRTTGDSDVIWSLCYESWPLAMCTVLLLTVGRTVIAQKLMPRNVPNTGK